MAKTKKATKKEPKPKGKAKAKPEPTAQFSAMEKQLTETRRLAKRIKDKDIELAEAETAVAGAKSALDDARDIANGIKRDLTELHNDLANVAVGGFAERLPFPAAPIRDSLSGEPVVKETWIGDKPASPADESWRQVKLADVWKETGGNVKLLELLRDGKVKQTNDAAKIETLGQLADFTAKRKLIDISGIGQGKADQIEMLTMKWYELQRAQAWCEQRNAELVKQKDADRANALETAA